MAGKVCPVRGCPNLKPCAEHGKVKTPWAGSNRKAELPAGWDKTVARIKKRDNYTCQKCGGTRCGNLKLEINHIGSKHDHSDKNLETLGARPCHLEDTLKRAQQARATKRR